MRDLARALGGLTMPFDMRGKARKISVAVTGLTTTPFHSAHARIGSPLGLEVNDLSGNPDLGPVSVRLGGTEVATTLPYTPPAASDGQTIAIGRYVDGVLHLSPAYGVRQAPPLVAGALPNLSIANYAVIGPEIPTVTADTGFDFDTTEFDPIYPGRRLAVPLDDTKTNYDYQPLEAEFALSSIPLFTPASGSSVEGDADLSDPHFVAYWDMWGTVRGANPSRGAVEIGSAAPRTVL